MFSYKQIMMIIIVIMIDHLTRVVMYAAGRAGLPSGTPTIASLAR